MIASSVQAEAQGTAKLCMTTARPAQNLQVGNEGPVCSVSKTATDGLNEDSAISMLGGKADKVLEMEFITNHEVQFPEPSLQLDHQDYLEKLKKLQFFLDMVSKIVKPGCSQEVLNVALDTMSSVVEVLSVMSSPPFSHSSL